MMTAIVLDLIFDVHREAKIMPKPRNCERKGTDFLCKPLEDLTDLSESCISRSI